MMHFAAIVFSVFMLQSPLVHADDKAPKKIPELTKEERTKHADWMEKMAETHKSMAECLRSEKPMADCHEQMKKECPKGKDEECPMMGGWHGMKGMHHDGRGRGKRMNQKALESGAEKEKD